MDQDAQMEREHKRQLIVEEAVREADRIILDESDGTVEMTNRMTTEMALVLIKHVTGDLASNVVVLHTTRQSVLKAKGVVEDIIAAKCSEDSDDVRRWLWHQVAAKFFEKVGIIRNNGLMEYDRDNPAETG